jgi:PTH1 family peptidyl-tRNA hydrolase
LRLRTGGSDGGQNGLADIIRTMGTQEFPRLRVGIGPVPERWNPADYVLGKFSAAERGEVALQVARSADAVRMWASQGTLPAMNRFNGKGN